MMSAAALGMTNHGLLVSVLSFALFSTVLPACDDDSDNTYPYGQSSSSSSGSSGSGTSGGGSSADEHPDWLVGPSWTKGYKLENNISFESEDKGIKFGGAPKYEVEEKVGKSWTTSGTWKVQFGSIQLSKGGSIPLSSMKANCKLLEHGGTKLFTTTQIDKCPSRRPLSSTACAKVGQYRKSTESGSSSSSYGTSTTYTLDPDGLITFTSGTFRSTCYGSTCKSLSNETAPTVGTWSLSGSTVTADIGAVDLAGFDFTPDTSSDCGT